MIPGGFITALFLGWLLIATSYIAYMCLLVCGVRFWRKGRKSFGSILVLSGILLCSWNPVFLIHDFLHLEKIGHIEVNLTGVADLSWKDDLDFGRFFDDQDFFAASGQIPLRIITPGGTEIRGVGRQISVDFDDTHTKSTEFYFYEKFTDEDTINLLTQYTSDFGMPRGGPDKLQSVTEWVKDGKEYASMSDSVGFENVLVFTDKDLAIALSLRRPSTRSLGGIFGVKHHKRLRSIQIRIDTGVDSNL